MLLNLGSTVVEFFTHNATIKGSIPAKVDSKMEKKFLKEMIRNDLTFKFCGKNCFFGNQLFLAMATTYTKSQITEHELRGKTHYSWQVACFVNDK
jgi:hypothetical protein